MKLKKHHLLFSYSFLILLVLYFHHKLIISDVLLQRDDILLVSSVRSTTSLPDYWNKLQEGYYYDIQPVRDLTFYLNLKFGDMTGYGAFHLTNIFLMFLMMFFFRKLLLRFKFNEETILLVISLVALHPLMNVITAWVSNRKHLLSIVFILLYGLEILKERPSGLKTNLWVLLSLLSQPITIFMAPLISIYRWMVLKIKPRWWDYSLFALSGAFLILNFYLYNSNYRFAGRVAVDAINKSFGLYILKIGRVAAQILTPFSFAAEYDVGNILNFLGIALMVILIYLHVKLEFSKKITPIYLIILTTLYPVLNWGPRDPYLLCTLLLSGYLAAKIISRYEFKKVLLFVLPLGLVYSVQAEKFTRMWGHDLVLTQISFETEGGAENLTKYVHMLATYNPDKAYELYSDAIVKFPYLVNPGLLLKQAQSLYEDPHKSDLEKLEIFRKNTDPNVFAVFFEAKLLKKIGDDEKYNNAMKALREILKGSLYQSFFRQILCVDNLDMCKELDIKF